MPLYGETIPAASDGPVGQVEGSDCSDAIEVPSKIIPIDGGHAVKQRTRKRSPGGLITSKKMQLDLENEMLPGNLFRLFVKNGEYVYARPDDIFMIESCDHLVKVHLGTGGKVKLTIRHSTLKDFLSQLPEDQFVRIGRFCAINIFRLSGGNCNRQVFEFDYNISIKLKHAVSNTVFTCIGK
jgi:hypothetical protein